MKILDFISYDEAQSKEEAFGGMGGFFQDGMRWKDYSTRYVDEVQPYVEALRQYVIENKICFGGDQHQSDCIDGVPFFEDGKVSTFSYRGWGDLMAAIWSEELNRDFHYMDFYMSPTKLENENSNPH